MKYLILVDSLIKIAYNSFFFPSIVKRCSQIIIAIYAWINQIKQGINKKRWSNRPENRSNNEHSIDIMIDNLLNIKTIRSGIEDNIWTIDGIHQCLISPKIWVHLIIIKNTQWNVRQAFWTSSKHEDCRLIILQT